MTMHMRKFAWLLAGVLAACATNHPKPASAGIKVTPQMRSGSNDLRAFQLLDWIAPDDRTLIVNSTDRSLFKAQFKRQCMGLRLVDTLAFIVPTPPQVAQYQGVVLPDGTRCVFTSMTRLETAPAPAHSKDGPATDEQ
jgi:hypothetical protein